MERYSIGQVFHLLAIVPRRSARRGVNLLVFLFLLLICSVFSPALASRLLLLLLPDQLPNNRQRFGHLMFMHVKALFRTNSWADKDAERFPDGRWFSGCVTFFFLGLSSSSCASLFTFFVGCTCFPAGFEALPASFSFLTWQCRQRVSNNPGWVMPPTIIAALSDKHKV